ELRELCLAIGRAAERDARILVERLVADRPATGHDVAARVQRQPMQPRREGGLAAELADLHAQLREGVLRGITRVLGIGEHVARQPAHPWSVAGTERLESEG